MFKVKKSYGDIYNNILNKISGENFNIIIFPLITIKINLYINKIIFNFSKF